MGETLEQRFWAKVDKRGPDECWPWLGLRGRLGYGQIHVEAGQKPRRSAHRVAWELHHGQLIPAGLHACHRCDNPSCVNPTHIFVGTPGDNIRDARDKGRLDTRAWAYRTHCVNGHEFTPENTLSRPDDGTRRCRTCKQERDRRYRREKREARAAA